MSVTQQTSADLQTQLAALTSASVMEQRATDLGYHPVEADQMEYLVVPGYAAHKPDILAAIPQPGLSAPSVPPEYTQSLLDWFDQMIQTLGAAQ